jgi:IclR family acetate operon transcriptional repressor
MSTALGRGLDILEHLAANPGGLSLTNIADSLDVPRSACHRMLVELKTRGYVRQLHALGDYVMTTRMAALGLTFLSSSGIVDIAQPLIERLAEASGELVRLAVVDDDRLTWVAKAEGGRKGFRYDPDMGMNARLSCTASGHAWMMTMTDEEAVALVSRQGFGDPREYGPKAPTTVKSLLGYLHAARVRDYAMIDEVFAPGMAAIAAPARHGDRPVIGVISIAGPRTRMTTERMQAMAPALHVAAKDLAATSSSSGLFSKPPLGKA